MQESLPAPFSHSSGCSRPLNRERKGSLAASGPSLSSCPALGRSTLPRHLQAQAHCVDHRHSIDASGTLGVCFWVLFCFVFLSAHRHIVPERTQDDALQTPPNSEARESPDHARGCLTAPGLGRREPVPSGEGGDAAGAASSRPSPGSTPLGGGGKGQPSGCESCSQPPEACC